MDQKSSDHSQACAAPEDIHKTIARVLRDHFDRTGVMVDAVSVDWAETIGGRAVIASLSMDTKRRV
jgi:hypothetical protein